MKLVYPAILRPFSDGAEGYVIEVPDLPGCVSEGGSMADAILNGIDAAAGWILGEWEDGLVVPAARRQTDIHTGSDEIVTLLPPDMDTYAEKYGEKAVRKNLTIPA